MRRATYTLSVADAPDAARCGTPPIALNIPPDSVTRSASKFRNRNREILVSNSREPLMDARRLIAELTRKNVVTCLDNTLLADIDGWDSLKGVRLILRLEKIVGRELSEDDIEGLQSVGDVERLLKSRA
jgi:acyl carrier protein